MPKIKLPCPCDGAEITGTAKSITQGFATGPAAEQAAIDEALHRAQHDADESMKQVECQGTCALSWKPGTVKIRSSGSQNNPAFEIIGEAVAVWTIYPVCSVPPPAGAGQPVPPKKKRPQKAGTPVALTPAVPGKDPYPVTQDIPCGTITICISCEKETEGWIVFDFQPKLSELCDCCEFGWIQHISRHGGPWHYDNGTRPGVASPQRTGAFSNPGMTAQPTERPAGVPPDDWTDNPWYGGYAGPAPAPPEFDQHPTPQTHISDKPEEGDTTFVTQLVCVETGEVFFSWYWGPVPDVNTPLGQVPAGKTPPP